MKYEFRNAAGAPCCKSDNIKLLCDTCVAQAIKQHEGTRAASDAEVPPPPSLADAIIAARKAGRR
jgi:hypothetical protein